MHENAVKLISLRKRSYYITYIPITKKGKKIIYKKGVPSGILCQRSKTEVKKKNQPLFGRNKNTFSYEFSLESTSGLYREFSPRKRSLKIIKTLIIAVTFVINSELRVQTSALDKRVFQI